MPAEVRLAIVLKALARHGWSLDRITGSHHIFKKEGEVEHINLPVHSGKVKPNYIRKIEKQLGISI